MAADHAVVSMREDGEAVLQPVEGLQGMGDFEILAEGLWKEVFGVRTEGVSDDEEAGLLSRI